MATDADPEPEDDPLLQLKEIMHEMKGHSEQVRAEVDKLALERTRSDDRHQLKSLRLGLKQPLQPGMRRIRRNFWGLELNEQDLRTYCSRVKQFLSQGNLQFHVETPGGADELASDDPDTFLDASMPRILEVITITCKERAIQCTTILDCGDRPQVLLEVAGTNTDGVSGVAHELERWLGDRQQWGRWLREALRPAPGGDLNGPSTRLVNVTIAGLCCVLCYVAAGSLLTAFTSITDRNIRQTFQAMAGMFGLFLGGNSGFVALRDLLPPVRFAGNLADPHAGRTNAVRVLLLVFVFPLLVSLLANFMSL